MERNVLDEALDDFASSSVALPVDDRASGKFSASHTVAEAGSSSSKDGDTASPAPQAFDPLGKGKKGKSQAAGGPAFDPLKQNRPARQAGSKGKGPITAAAAAGSSGQSSKSSGQQQSSSEKASAQPQNSGMRSDIDAELARGVAQLMADLAKAAPSAGEDAGKSMPHEREIASTLAALAAAVPSRGAEGASSQSSSAQRLEEQIDSDADGSFASLADSIMQQLLSKDVLYQPMKDIGAKYPAWLATRRDSLPPEELKRYEAQYKYIRQICALYEDDSNNFSQLFTLIQEMQACGQPPEEIVQDLAPGLAFGEDGLPQLPASATDNCIIC